MKESAIVRQILEGLAAIGVFAFRINTGAIKTAGRFFRVHSLGVGTADILALPYVKGFAHSNECLNHPVTHIVPVWIECKTATGRQSPEQKSFQEHVVSLGHEYVLARSFDDVRSLWAERVQGVRG